KALEIDVSSTKFTTIELVELAVHDEFAMAELVARAMAGETNGKGRSYYQELKKMYEDPDGHIDETNPGGAASLTTLRNRAYAGLVEAAHENVEAFQYLVRPEAEKLLDLEVVKAIAQGEGPVAVEAFRYLVRPEAKETISPELVEVFTARRNIDIAVIK